MTAALPQLFDQLAYVLSRSMMAVGSNTRFIRPGNWSDHGTLGTISTFRPRWRTFFYFIGIASLELQSGGRFGMATVSAQLLVC